MAKTLGRKIYQERKVDEPWCIWVIATKEKRRCTADAEIYAEWIPCRSKCFKVKGVSIIDPRTMAAAVNKVCDAYGHPLDAQDTAQIIEELNDLKDGFNH